MVKRSSSRSKKADKRVVITLSNRNHILMLYSLLTFTWVMVLSMFAEQTGGFVINFRAAFFGLVIGIGAASLVYHIDKKLH